jgi:hypothetical protein
MDAQKTMTPSVDHPYLMQISSAPYSTLPIHSPTSPSALYCELSSIDSDLPFPELQDLATQVEPNQSSWDILLQSSLDNLFGGSQLSRQNTKHLCEAGEKTTLCSIAYRLVFQCNKQGLGDTELNVKMQHGFQAGRTRLEGCRIDNEVLISVLAEISR